MRHVINLSDCYVIKTYKRLVLKQTLNHLDKLS